METTEQQLPGSARKAAAIAAFYAVALALRYLTNQTDLLAACPWDNLKVILSGAGPAVGAMVGFLILRQRMTMSLKGYFRSYWAPVTLYLLLPVALLGAAAYFTIGTLPVVAVLSVLVYGLLEEIGWRGFLQQNLQSLPQSAWVVIIASMWFAWHFNFAPTLANLIFYLILLLGTWGLGFVADRTRSLLAVAAFHSLVNFFMEYNALKLSLLALLLVVWIGSVVVLRRQMKGSPK